MMLVCPSHRYYDMSHLDIEFLTERFLNPELFECHFASAFYFALVFAGFFLFYFNGAFSSSVLELDFTSQRPSFAEVVTYVENHMRKVKSAVTFSGIVFRIGVSEIVVTEEVSAVCSLAISSECKSAFFLFLFLVFCTVVGKCGIECKGREHDRK